MPLQVELVSPEGILFEGTSTMVVVRTVGGGDIAFMPGHVPFIGSLDVYPAKIYGEDGGITVIAVHRGFVEVANDHVSILSDVAELSADIDVPRAEAARADAQERLRANTDDDDAKADLQRAEVRLQVASGSLVPGH
jgi:F-type H+-transporting ATPase subunit epsilon